VRAVPGPGVGRSVTGLVTRPELVRRGPLRVGFRLRGAPGLGLSYALQSGYEPLLRGNGTVTAEDLARLADRFTLAGDARDVLDARDSLMQLLGIRPFGS
jgi:hypothetical protein